MKKLLALLTILICVSGCAHRANYDINLAQVERPSDAKERYGESTIIKFEEEGKTKYSFEDEMLKIVWLPTAERFHFVISNKTSHSIRIIWDEAVYVDENGTSKRIMHQGVKYSERNNPQPPTTIVRGATVSDSIIPTDNVRYVRGRYGGWRESPLFPESSEQRQLLEERAKALVGERVQVLLPIQIQDVVNEYIFVFSIDGYSITEPGS